MKRRRLVILASMAFIAILTFWLKSEGQKTADAVRVQFLGMTNDPAFGRAALFCVTNRAVSEVFCGREATQVCSSCGWVNAEHFSGSALAWLELGESYEFAVPVPGGTGPWRVPVSWQRRDLGRIEMFVNSQIGRCLPFFGKPNVHRDPWVPLWHVVYSPEITR